MHLLKTKYTSLLALPLLLVLCVFALPSQKVFAASTYTLVDGGAFDQDGEVSGAVVGLVGLGLLLSVYLIPDLGETS
ncbi:hypothetical protein H6800_01355 [Candidatus Nomurabacteria bacterium]|nr:hypothetical protein [Candidatus Nomurabacteria bacterium]